MKTKILFIYFILFGLLSCSQTEKQESREFNIEDIKNYEIQFINNNYEFDINSQIFTSEYFKLKDSIRMSKDEKNSIAKLFFENYIDTIKTDVTVQNDEGIFIQPDLAANSVIVTKTINNDRVELYINGNADSLKVNSVGKDILQFKEKTFDILRNNKDFKNALEEMHSKKDDRVFY